MDIRRKPRIRPPNTTNPSRKRPAAVPWASSLLLALLTHSLCAQPAPDTLWTRHFGGPGDDVAYCVRQTHDGGWAYAGFITDTTATPLHYYFGKTDSLGHALWSRNISYNPLPNDKGPAGLQPSADGGYLGLEPGYASFTLFRLDSARDSLWYRGYSIGSGNGLGLALEITPSHDIVVGGWTCSVEYSHGLNDMFLTMLDSMGTVLWTRGLGGSESETFTSMCRDSARGYFLTGYASTGSREPTDFCVIHADTAGDMLWMRNFDVTDNDIGTAVTAADRGCVVAGYTADPGMPDGDIVLARLDSAGSLEWQHTYRRSGSDKPQSILRMPDGGFLVAGYTWVGPAGFNFDCYLLRTDAQGNTLWTATYGGPNWDEAKDLRFTADGGCIIAGKTRSFGAHGSDCWLIKLGPEELASGPTVHSLPSGFQLSVYPNPFNASAHVTFSLPHPQVVRAVLYDILGRQSRELTDKLLPAGPTNLVLSSDGLASGMYILRVKTLTSEITRRVILAK